MEKIEKQSSMDRRRFVNLIGKTLAVSSASWGCNSNINNYSNVTDPEKTTPNPNLKPKYAPLKSVIKWSDFEFLGAFRPPHNSDYDFTRSGLTHRWINDKLYLLGLSQWERYTLFEPVQDELLSQTYPFPVQNEKIICDTAMMRPYRDIHSSPEDWNAAPLLDQETPVTGFTWHQEENRLYWAHQHGYCNDQIVFPCLGASTMPATGSGRILGLWKVSDGQHTFKNRFVCQTDRIPKDWADKYVGGRQLLVGFGWQGYTDQSIVSNGGTFGPTFGAVFHPNPSIDENFSLVQGGMTVINTHEHGSAPGFDDCPAYYLFNMDVDRTKPLRSTKWTHTSGHSYGVWIDVPDKHGVLVPSSHPSSDFLTTIAPDPPPTLRTLAVVDPEVLPQWLPGYNLQIMDPGISRSIQARIVESVSGRIVTLSSDMVQTPPVGAYVFGGVSYPNGVGGYIVTASVNRMNIYNPDELGENILSNEPTNRQTTPSEYGTITYPGIPELRPTSDTGYCIGITFDAKNRRLYLQILNTRWAQGRRSAICVYKLH